LLQLEFLQDSARCGRGILRPTRRSTLSHEKDQQTKAEDTFAEQHSLSPELWNDYDWPTNLEPHNRADSLIIEAELSVGLQEKEKAPG
jgi:hypothetical protein